MRVRQPLQVLVPAAAATSSSSPGGATWRALSLRRRAQVELAHHLGKPGLATAEELETEFLRKHSRSVMLVEGSGPNGLQTPLGSDLLAADLKQGVRPQAGRVPFQATTGG